MIELISNLANEYSNSITSDEDDILNEINNYTNNNHALAHMLSGKVQGKFLQFISKITHPKNVLDIGTFTGYSAICLSEGLQKDGKVYTIELRQEDAKIANEFFIKANKQNQINLHIGNALEIIPQLNLKWDLVFIDADKTAYIDYYEMLMPLLNTNGLIIADNVLFHGLIFEDEIKNKSAKAIKKFNEHVANDNRTEQVLLTIRDGLLLIRKK
jgi:caffeoyl-CoA O-methyltransferase